MTSLRGHDRSEFSRKVRADAFRRCCDSKGIPHCEGCGVEITASSGCFFEHMDPDGLGGKPTLENCQVRCKTCKLGKDKIDNRRMAKADRVLAKTYGIKRPSQKIKSRGFTRSDPQHSASKPIARRLMEIS